MLRKILESSVLFVDIIKWFIIATVTGIVVGTTTAIFIKLLEVSTGLADHYPYYFLILPLAMAFSAWVINRFAPEARGHGTEKVIQAIHRKSGKMSGLSAPIKLIATVITIAAGGSVGKEGPAAQIGASVSSKIADILKFNDRDRKRIVICGLSAGFASIFGTPIAGALFGVEVLFVGTLLYEVLFPSFVAGIIGYQCAMALGADYFHSRVTFLTATNNVFILEIVLSGIVFGIISFILIEAMAFFRSIRLKMNLPGIAQGLLGGSILVGITLIFLILKNLHIPIESEPTRYLGLGLTTIDTVLQGHSISYLAAFWKIIFTSITLNFGGSGGIVTSVFFIGASAGNSLGVILHSDPRLFAAIGMIALLAGSANTPVAASIMFVELFGSDMAAYAALACIVSFLMTGHRSIYPSQILSLVKSDEILIDTGREMEHLREVRFKKGQREISEYVVKGGVRLRRKFRRKNRRSIVKKPPESTSHES